MEPLSVHVDITDPASAREFAVDEIGKVTAIGALPNGCESGKPSVHFVIEIESEGEEIDGMRIRGYTTLELLRTAVRALEARYEDVLAP